MPNSLMRSSALTGLGSVPPTLSWYVIQFTPHAVLNVAIDPRTRSFLDTGSISFRRALVNDCRSRLAYDLVLRIRTARSANCADNHALIDEWDTASRCNNSVEGEQIVQVHELDAVLEDLGWTP